MSRLSMSSSGLSSPAYHGSSGSGGLNPSYSTNNLNAPHHTNGHTNQPTGTNAGVTNSSTTQPPPATTDYWTHSDIDYSWRFPYPEHQQKEYFSPLSYTDEDVRRQRTHPSSSSSSSSTPSTVIESWRSRDRMRTQCVALVACLNIGVDPPDIVRPVPCARMECWLDPESMLPAKSLKAIGGRLQLQYERWHERAKYKTLLDPTAEELRKTLISLRRVANEERVLMHYNGHGVPKPTTNGEIWVYNKGYTQYIPVSLYDLQTWMGGVSAPSMYVFDCSQAGIIVETFQHFMTQRKDKLMAKLKSQQFASGHNNNTAQQNKSLLNGPSVTASGEDSETPLDEAQMIASVQDPCRHIILAACTATETLPLSPELPADLFTACLTTPIKMALRWFVSRSSLLTTQTNQKGGSVGGPSASSTRSHRTHLYELIEKLPGIRKPNNRKSPFGELNWIFTAITDSIAWNILPRDVFQKLFRQDLLVSSLFRNFLLAQRIMATYNCTVMSVPPISPTHNHPLWACWDLACDIALSQLERFELHQTPFQSSTFFEEQLTSFEIWLDSPMNQLEGNQMTRPPPMQLPVVLQVLLSSDHRLRALQLLARFMDKGTWAINLALSVGIFPYVLKLLQSPSKDLREVLVFIWAKILALDRGVSSDLSKIEYASWFIQHLLKYHATPLPGSSPLISVTRSPHSRSPSIAPSPILRPAYSLTSTPALTPAFAPAFHTFTSQTNAPRESTAGQQFNFNVPPPQRSQVAGGSDTETSPTAGENVHRSSNPPPLDLPPSEQTTLVTGVTTHSAHLRDHPTQPRVHMRAQPLHDPAVARGTMNANYVLELMPEPNEEPTAATDPTLTATQPPVSPSLQPTRVPFPIDLTAPTSGNSPPLLSPIIQTLSNSKSSPMLTGMAFSPSSPMLSPSSKPDGAFAGQQFDPTRETKPNTQQETIPDAHDLTHLAREILHTSSLQHLLALFIISCIAHGNPKGQQILMQSGLASFKELTAPHLLHSPDQRVRIWACLTIGKCWQGFSHSKTIAANEGIPDALIQVLMDPVPDVRCAALWSLGAFFGGRIVTPDKVTPPSSGANSPIPTPAQQAAAAKSHALRAQARLDLELQLGAAMATLMNDGSPTVRRELMLSLAELVYFQQDLFLTLATAHPRARESISPSGIFIWRAILRGCRDCSSQVQEVSLAIKGYLKGRAILNQSLLGRMIGSQHNPGIQFARENIGSITHENIEEEEDELDGGRKRSPSSRDASPSRTATSDPHRHSTSTSRGSTSISDIDRSQSIAHIDADELTSQEDGGLPIHEYHDRDVNPQPTRRPVQNNQPPIRHFNRLKMSHLRPGASNLIGGSGAPIPTNAAGIPGSGGQRRSVEKSHLLKSMETAATSTADSETSTTTGSGSLDERAADQMWTVPKSRVFEDAYAAMGQPLLVPTETSHHIFPQSRPLQPPSMADIRQTKWRYARNQAIISHARELRHMVHPAKSSYVEVAFLNAEWESTSCVTFHPYESMLIAADHQSRIGVWNYSMDDERGRERLNTFSNDNPPGTKITQLEFVNDASVSLLLVASDEGVVRIWRGVHEEGQQQLVTAWVANPPVEYQAPTMGTMSDQTPPPSNTSSIFAPSQSYQDVVNITSSSMTPQSRLMGRPSTGVGVPMNINGTVGPITSVGMRHSVSTPALAQSQMTPTSRSGSVSSVSGSLLPTHSSSNFSNNRSPSIQPISQSPNLAPTSAAMNIPNYSLGGGPNSSHSLQPPSQNAQQRNSPSQSPPRSASISSNNSSALATTLSTRRKRPPLIVDWQQNRGRLLASGHGLEYLRIWDVTREQCIGEIPIFGHESLESHLPTHVTSMNSNGNEIVWVGCFDGSVRCFDLRLPPIESLVSSARLHRSPVQSVRLQRRGYDGGMLVSASIGGDIALADVRNVDSSVVRYHRSSHKDKSSNLDAFAVHDYAPICASGSHKPFIEIFDHAGQTLDTIKYHVGFLGQRIGPINTLAFHRHKLLLAAGALDSFISIFESKQ